jgi:hypothetical protein
MIKRILAVGVLLCAAFALGAVAFAQEPHVNVGEKHGNMRAAQQLIQQAWQSGRGAEGQSLQSGRACGEG